MKFKFNTDPKISLGYPHRPDDMPEQLHEGMTSQQARNFNGDKLIYEGEVYQVTKIKRMQNGNVYFWLSNETKSHSYIPYWWVEIPLFD